MKFLKQAATILMASTLWCSFANAALVTTTFNFAATGFGPPAPTDPVLGSFTINFDDAVNATNQTAGISLNSLNIPFTGNLAFTYTTDPGGNFLTIGSDLNGANDVQLSTQDFRLQLFSVASGAPFQYQGFDYSDGTANVFESVTVTAVPLPAAVWLLGAGLFGLTPFARRRKAE